MALEIVALYADLDATSIDIHDNTPMLLGVNLF
jgi:hypothetical protein